MNDTTKWEERFDKEFRPATVRGIFYEAIHPALKDFIRNELSSQKQAVEKIVEQLEQEPRRLEREHAAEFRKDESAFLLDPSDELKEAKMLKHQSGNEQWRGGMNQGYLKALDDILNSLKEI